MHNPAARQHTSPMHRPYVRDEQWDQKWQDAWNNAKPAQRKQWLIDAGFESEAKNYKTKSWDSLFVHMRRDVITIIKREQSRPPTPTPQLQSTKVANPEQYYWWNKENFDV